MATISATVDPPPAALAVELPRDPLERHYVAACLAAIEAPKPGNVSLQSPGHDMTADDFVISALVSAAPLCALSFDLGRRVLEAVRTTRAAVACNTNLGILLLCAPLLMAAQHRRPGQTLRAASDAVLDALTVRDTADVFAAIRHASPAGLGESAAHDVSGPATTELREVMTVAASRDRIARQYAAGFADVYDLGMPLLNDAAKRFESRALRTVAIYLGLLARIPDTHILRKFDSRVAAEVRRRARIAEEALQRRGATRGG